MFDTIETLRRTAVKFRREGNDADGKLLQERVKRLQGSDPNSVARAFSYFLHLSNIAEDRDQNRRQRARALADPAPSRGSLRETVQTLGRHGVGPARIRRLLAEACVMPVLTAHPPKCSARARWTNTARSPRRWPTATPRSRPRSWPRSTPRCWAAWPRCGRPACCATPV